MDNYKYMLIVDWVKEYIAEKGLKHNDRFLTEKQLCEIHGVSRQTVRQALMMLESENIIVRVRGSGTFVGSRTAVSAPVSVKGSIGVISTYFSDYIFPHIVTGVESVLGAAGCTMQLAITHNQVYEETQALESMLANGVQGLIVEPSKSALPNPNMELYAKLKRENIPLVFFNAKYPWADQPCVAMDDIAAGRTVTDHLFDCGHTAIAGIFALDDLQGHKRYSGYMQSCLRHGIRESERNVMWFATSEREDMFSSAEDKLVSLLKGKTAVVCYNDKIAVRLLKLCRDRDIKVPGDISVVGIDDSRYASICEVPLTTVHHPQKKLGEAAAELLLGMIEGRVDQPRDILFTPELVTRESVADLRLNGIIKKGL
ncbi:GntR family transcriptional regulator [Ruminococcus albus]|uniref:Transcriptional regulator, GntR family with LacI sensor n=1 Tax=Ruminococcus albus (strain ATCC 27210 / DSM 20455 / JCM 14654 / NCDO 2250 / 7) TaxID=697329 RepID=E6UF57_RUMA7|nr:GntR family transcriptional regulator [Ruminococcus albus]ADU23584.1 transcriptional regulator, GntR family with LacI sensor [Ruminococcus albus 7 = DSM 20455]